MVSSPPRVQASGAAERARLVSEYQQRRREAAANKARAAVQWGVHRAPIEGGGGGRDEAVRQAGVCVMIA